MFCFDIYWFDMFCFDMFRNNMFCIYVLRILCVLIISINSLFTFYFRIWKIKFTSSFSELLCFKLFYHLKDGVQCTLYSLQFTHYNWNLKNKQLNWNLRVSRLHQLGFYLSKVRIRNLSRRVSRLHQQPCFYLSKVRGRKL